MPSTHHGLLVLDKPVGISSRKAVDLAARWFPPRTSIGHTGTLDPFAGGVLVLCVGVATRLAEYVQQMGKVYRARFHLGARSDTDDVEGPIHAVVDAQPPDMPTVNTVCSEFIGRIEQVPPKFSAVKVAGKRAYKLARQGTEVELAARTVHISRIDVLDYAYPFLDLEIRCGEGTYIRSLARDFGDRFGCGAYAEELVRLKVGGFCVENAVALDTDAATVMSRLLPPKAAVHYLHPVHLDAPLLDRLRSGQSVPGNGLVPKDEWEIDPRVAVFDGDNLAAIAEYVPETQQLRPRKVLIY